MKTIRLLPGGFHFYGLVAFWMCMRYNKPGKTNAKRRGESDMRRKAWLCALLGLTLLLCLSGCKAQQTPALTVDGVPVSGGVYQYYLHDALRRPAQYGIAEGDETAAKAQAETRCRQIVALERYLKENNITVRADLKRDAVAQVEGQWALFGAHYRELGMTKPDLTRILMFDAQKKQLVQTLFGTGGKHEVALQTLKESFSKLYVGFKAFEGALTKQNDRGETVELSKAEQKSLRESFRQMANRANSGTDLDALFAEYSETQGLVVTSPLSVSIMKDGDPMYDADFFSQVSALQPGETGVIESTGSLYLLQRVDITASDDDAFEAYRDEVLYREKMADVEQRVATLGEKAVVTQGE